ncbi:MAG: aspartate aminotransferase family protein [Pseudohongiellaceae bacterium]
MNVMEVEDCLGIEFYERQPLVIERGEGNYVWDESGKKYLDFTSGWGVTCLGHAHPVITEAICSQARKIIQNPNSGFAYSPARARLLLTLQQVLPAGLNRVFFANSGAEANDAAIKLARKITGRTRIVSALGSFHGRTFNTLTVSGGTQNTNRFLPQISDTAFVPFGDQAALVEAIDGNTAAFIVEPIQGEGGVRIPLDGYLALAERLCLSHGAMLIIDEIQTGFCRTGKFFAIQHSGNPVHPDIMTMGKGIAGGFPFGALAINDRVNSGIEKGDHGGTYCGNPLGSAVACAVVSALQDLDIASHVSRIGKSLIEGMERLRRKYPALIREVRGVGLLTALDLGDDQLVKHVTSASLEHGLLVTPTRGGVIRLIPGLLVQEQEIAQALSVLDKVFSNCVTPVAAAS